MRLVFSLFDRVLSSRDERSLRENDTGEGVDACMPGERDDTARGVCVDATRPNDRLALRDEMR